MNVRIGDVMARSAWAGASLGLTPGGGGSAAFAAGQSSSNACHRSTSMESAAAAWRLAHLLSRGESVHLSEQWQLVSLPTDYFGYRFSAVTSRRRGSRQPPPLPNSWPALFAWAVGSDRHV